MFYFFFPKKIQDTLEMSIIVLIQHIKFQLHDGAEVKMEVIFEDL